MEKKGKQIIAGFWIWFFLMISFSFFIVNASAEMTELTGAQMKATHMADTFIYYVLEENSDPFEDQKKELAELAANMRGVYPLTKPDSYREKIKVRAGMEIAGIFEVGSTVFHNVINSNEGITITAGGYVNVTAAGTSIFEPSTMTVYHHEFYSQVR